MTATRPGNTLAFGLAAEGPGSCTRPMPARTHTRRRPNRLWKPTIFVDATRMVGIVGASGRLITEERCARGVRVLDRRRSANQSGPASAAPGRQDLRTRIVRRGFRAVCGPSQPFRRVERLTSRCSVRAAFSARWQPEMFGALLLQLPPPKYPCVLRVGSICCEVRDNV